MTAYELAQEVIDENRPFDYRYLRQVFRTCSRRELHDWAVGVVEPFALPGMSRQMIGRAANIMTDYLRSAL